MSLPHWIEDFAKCHPQQAHLNIALTGTLDHERPRIVFKLSAMRSAGQVSRTPQFKHWPLYGDVLMAFELPDSMQTTITPDFLDKKGQKTTVDGVPEWSTDNTEVVALTPAADGLSCLVKAVGPLGSARVSMKADADRGAGVTEIVGVINIDVTAGDATTITLSASPPEEQSE